jgi:hypothetical protein
MDYCRRHAWAGYDAYDGLDSRWLQRPVLRDSRRFRELVRQLNTYSPINLRPMLGIARSCNPKALGLCLAATVRLFRLNPLRSTDPIVELVGLIKAGRSAHPNDSWGYSFPWQTRTQLVPKDLPKLVCTVFVANARARGGAPCRVEAACRRLVEPRRIVPLALGGQLPHDRSDLP